MAEIKILLVEDDPALGFVIQDMLREAGYIVHLCRDGKAGLLQFNQQPYDLCLLDVMMPKKDGFELARDIRKLQSEVPIIFLSAKSMVEDKIEGLKTGADDYITKPFSNEEILLRIEAVLKRAGHKGIGQNEESQLIEFGHFSFAPNEFQLTDPKQSRILTKKESDILRLLLSHKNRVIERELIGNMVWGDDSYFIGRSLDVFISKLRKYLSSDPRISIINIHGVGFRLEVPEGVV